jgi:hypothetical protein
MDGDGEVLTPHLKCDIELEFTGPTVGTINKWAARALRMLADRIEKGGFEDGHHPVQDSVGKGIGTIYVDYWEENA